MSILHEDAAGKYLGRKLCVSATFHEVECRNRLAAGWASFHKHKAELCCKHYSLSDRVRLFEAVITPVVLHGCSSWTLTSSLERGLKTTWRRMLRFVFGIHRRRNISNSDSEETWVDYVRRAAHAIEAKAVALGMEGWHHMYRRRKWRFAGRVVRQTGNRWSTRAVHWVPCNGHGRRPGRPFIRWSDDIANYAGGNWADVAADTEWWAVLEEGFGKRL